MATQSDVIAALNILAKVESSTIKLSGDPGGLDFMSAAVSLASSVTNALSLTGLSLGGANALLNGLNVPMQLANLNAAIESGDSIKIAAAALALGSSIAGAIGSVPSPIQGYAKAIGVGLGIAALAVGNPQALAESLKSVWDAFSDMWTTVFPSVANNGDLGDIDPLTYVNYTQSRMTEIRRRDPMVFDLDGDGLETVGIDPNAPILFDHNGDGIKTGTGWVSSDDAFLVLDRNGNGSIDSGRELFGDSTPLAGGGAAADGFAALAAEDTNHDGQVNASDANFANLRLWRDLNQDGVSQSNELISLTSAGIQSINVGSTEHSQTLNNGNQIADLGTYTRADGSQGVLGEVTGNLGDINLADIPFFNEFTDSIPLTEEAQGLPDIHGSGQVRDLQQAASLDGNLAAMVNGLLDAGAQTRGQLWGQLDQLIALWANTSSMEGSFEIASDAGYDLEYIPQGMSLAEAQGYVAGEAGTMVSPEEAQHLLDMQAKQARLQYLISVLERFNGAPFVVIQADDGGFEVRTGNGQVLATTVTETPDPVDPVGTISRRCYLWVNDDQLTLLEQSYAALKNSVYDGLVLETRLRPYLDAMSLNIDENGITMDFSAMENMLSDYRQSDRINAFIDRAELVRYAGAAANDGRWRRWA